MMSTSFVESLWSRWTNWISASFMSQSSSGVRVFAHASMPNMVYMNIKFYFLNAL